MTTTTKERLRTCRRVLRCYIMSVAMLCFFAFSLMTFILLVDFGVVDDLRLIVFPGMFGVMFVLWWVIGAVIDKVYDPVDWKSLGHDVVHFFRSLFDISVYKKIWSTGKSIREEIEKEWEG